VAIRQRRQEAQHGTPAAPWHASPVEAVYAALGSGPAGLDEDEVARRLAVYGRNRPTPPKRRGPLVRFLLHFTAW
jgi:Cation transporter/ATPase, N-terminus